jgi:hypothetical protein
MSYDLKAFGVELLLELEKGYDIVRISNWAYRTFFDLRDPSPSLTSSMMTIIAMQEGEQFELTESELRVFAANLLKGNEIQ